MGRKWGSTVPGTNLVTRWSDDGAGKIRGEVLDVTDWSVRYDSGWQVKAGDAGTWISYEMTGIEAGEFYGAVLKLEGWDHHEVEGGVLAYRIGEEVDQAILVMRDGTVRPRIMVRFI